MSSNEDSSSEAGTDLVGNRTFTDDGLIVPRKIPNPYVGSREKKDLHKEMLWKLKYGGDDPKSSEYQKAFNNFQNRQRLKAMEVESAGQSTFEKMLEERRLRLNQVGSIAPAEHLPSLFSSTHNAGSEPQYFPNNCRDGLECRLHHYQIHSFQNPKPINTSSPSNPIQSESKSVPHRDEFHRVFDKVRSKSSTLSDSNGGPDPAR